MFHKILYEILFSLLFFLTVCKLVYHPIHMIFLQSKKLDICTTFAAAEGKIKEIKEELKKTDFVLKSAEFRQNQRSAHRLENAVLSPTFQSVLYVKADLFSWKQALPELCAFVWVCVSLCVWAVVFGRQGVSKQRKNLSEEVDLEPDCWGGATNNDSLCFFVLYTCAGSARVSLCTCSADGKVVDYVTLERVMQCSVSLASKRSHPSFLFFSFFVYSPPTVN